MLPIFVALIVALFGNFTVDPLGVSFMYVSNLMSSVIH